MESGDSMDEILDPELEKLKAEQAGNANKKIGLNLLGGIGDTLSSRNGFGNFFLGKMAPQSTAVSKTTGAIADGIQDPMDRQKKAMEYIKNKRGEAKAVAAADPKSAQSISKAKLLSGVFKKFAPYIEGKSDDELNEIMPILSQVARGEEDRALRAQDMQARNADRDESRRTRLDEKARKDKELSATQAKQRGLYEMGKKSEEQFSNAIADKGDYDPTAVGQVIDNSSWAPNWMKNNKAVESQSAQASWIESFLRDASGAAIPHSERASYAEIYFPQPGDTEDVVKNKAALRAQKMDSARIAAGVEAGHGPADTPMVASAKKSPSELAKMELARRAAAKNTAGR